MSETGPSEAEPHAAGEPVAQSKSAEQGEERTGALRVQRIVKDDGRALIAYWHETGRA